MYKLYNDVRDIFGRTTLKGMYYSLSETALRYKVVAWGGILTNNTKFHTKYNFRKRNVIQTSYYMYRKT